MRVLVLTPDFPPVRGGIQTLVHRLVSNLQGIETRVVTLDAVGAQEFDRCEHLDVHRTHAVGQRRLAVAGLNATALREAVRFRPAVVLSAHIVMSPAAAVIARALGRPVVQYVYAKEIRGKPRLAAFAAHQATAIIAISRYSEQLVRGVGADSRRIRLISPGVDLPPLTRSSLTLATGEPPRLITVSRLEDRYKGQDVLMRAMPLIRAQIPGAELVVVGDGPLRGYLERLAGTHGISDCVRFVGAVDDADRDAWLQRSRVFAMPSRLPAAGLAGEGFGIVYLEAGWRGLPVVAGNVAGALDAVVDGETGLLVDPTDHVAVAQSIATLLADPQRAATMGRAGIAHAREFSWVTMAGRVGELLREVATRRR